MPKRAFKMFLKPGMRDEYRRRHDQIWPELSELLRATGVAEYLIYFDPATDALFAIVDQADDDRAARIGESPVMRKWWAYMADIMITNDDHSPVTGELTEVFRLS